MFEIYFQLKWNLSHFFYEYVNNISYFFPPGVMMAVDTVVEELKSMSKQVTTPEEIAQVKKV